MLSRTPTRLAPSPIRRSRPVRQLLATAATTLLLVGYGLPAYADVGHPEPAVAFQATLAAQTYSANVVAGAPVTVRGSYTVIPKPVPKPEPKPAEAPAAKSVLVRGAANLAANRSASFANDRANQTIQWPLPRGTRISSGFGPRVSPCGGCSSTHEGLDFDPGAGAPISSIAAGVVSKLGNPSGSYGVYAVIDHVIDGQRVSSLYAHMRQGSLAISVGETVQKGQVIGRVGSTGASSGAHLHLGIYLNGTKPIDPYTYLRNKIGS